MYPWTKQKQFAMLVVRLTDMSRFLVFFWMFLCSTVVGEDGNGTLIFFWNSSFHIISNFPNAVVEGLYILEIVYAPVCALSCSVANHNSVIDVSFVHPPLPFYWKIPPQWRKVAHSDSEMTDIAAIYLNKDGKISSSVCFQSCCIFSMK